MEEVVTNIAMIVCIVLSVVFVTLIVVGCICMVRETIREHNKNKPKKKLNQDEIKHLYFQLTYYKNLVEYYREKIDKIRREK